MKLSQIVPKGTKGTLVIYYEDQVFGEANLSGNEKEERAAYYVLQLASEYLSRVGMPSDYLVTMLGNKLLTEQALEAMYSKNPLFSKFTIALID